MTIKGRVRTARETGDPCERIPKLTWKIQSIVSHPQRVSLCSRPGWSRLKHKDHDGHEAVHKGHRIRLEWAARSSTVRVRWIVTLSGMPISIVLGPQGGLECGPGGRPQIQ